MGFFDVNEFNKAADDGMITPHPLAEKLSLAAKISYLGLVVFASFVDDGEISEKERKAMRETGLALKLPESEIDDTVNTVAGLKDNSEKMSFIKESLPALSERDTAMFLYCDMVGAMTADGAMTDDAGAFLSGMAKFLKISREDLNFLTEYTAFFQGDRKPEAAETVFKYAAQKLPEGLVSYFTPTLNSVRIPGGRLPLGDNNFCDGHFRIDSEVIVGAGVKLLVKNAEIEFGINGWIEIEDGDAEFIDSEFIAAPGEGKKEEQQCSSYYLILSEIPKLSFSGCTFDGRMIRAAIYQENILDIKDCRFDNLNGGDASGVFCRDGFCRDFEFNCCKGCCLYSGNSKIDRCKFINCSSKSCILETSVSLKNLRMLFKKCKAAVICNNGLFLHRIVKSKDNGAVCFLDCTGMKFSGCDYESDYETWLKAYNDEKWEIR